MGCFTGKSENICKKICDIRDISSYMNFKCWAQTGTGQNFGQKQSFACVCVCHLECRTSCQITMCLTFNFASIAGEHPSRSFCSLRDVQHGHRVLTHTPFRHLEDPAQSACPGLPRHHCKRIQQVTHHCHGGDTDMAVSQNPAPSCTHFWDLWL